MQIVMLEGSPHRYGSSNSLAAEFVAGARDAGHEVTEFKVAQMVIQPCFGCGHCQMDGPCFYDDDMSMSIRGAILDADMIVFVTPIYYFMMSAQLKTVIDRFYSFSFKLSARHLKSALITAAYDSNEDVMTCIEAYYGKLCSYMNFENQGMVMGLGCGTPAETRASRYMKDAYELGLLL